MWVDFNDKKRVSCFGNQRWLLTYVTAGESYVNAPNLTTAVYVLEITSKKAKLRHK